MYGAVALGAILLQAQFSMQYGAIWQGTFWFYHFQLLAGFTAILWGVVVEYSRGRTVQSPRSPSRRVRPVAGRVIPMIVALREGAEPDAHDRPRRAGRGDVRASRNCGRRRPRSARWPRGTPP
jgi:hypothetical protein